MKQCGSDTVKCLHCSETHSAGSGECSKYQREENLIIIQGEEKITLMKAMQILENNNEFIETVKQQFNTYFDCKMNESDKKKITLWLLEKCLERELDSKP